MTAIFRRLMTVCLSPTARNISNQARLGAPPSLSPCHLGGGGGIFREDFHEAPDGCWETWFWEECKGLPLGLLGLVVLANW